MRDPMINYQTATRIAASTGTPVFVYDEAQLKAQAEAALTIPAPFGLTVRYAMKAAPTRAILRLFSDKGLHFDASSGYEAERLLAAGIDASKISLSTQELPVNFVELVQQGMSVNACSLNQLETYGKALPGTQVGLRFNPGLGSGGTNRTNVGGPASSFGIWNAKVEEVRAILEKFSLCAFRIHTHIGSGSDPEVWKRAASLSLRMAEAYETVTHFNLGGGFKVARVEGENSTDLQACGAPVAQLLEDFAERTGRKLHFEIEPGTFLIANAGALLTRVQDIVDTGEEGYSFLKIDAGMTEILRPSLYGAQHPIELLQAKPGTVRRPVIVVGHCCESGDILTPAPGDPEALSARDLPDARIGDFALIGGAGAYCSAMSAKNYNSFPEAPEILLCTDGSIKVIRKRQTLEQILVNEA
ncbi:diaminopimelate decarboxylase [Puniceicoccales bacterium CK1056]|uniref:Diaminopimelate decarboxylase n=2 Tax=Oceanipulchritudo coccoides TaxID=2706888 RepID=A0A6B2M363_9BACT|nr:diaminopimelate decarboxylase [Oceanipulchritudo coccoides]